MSLVLGETTVALQATDFRRLASDNWSTRLAGNVSLIVPEKSLEPSDEWLPIAMRIAGHIDEIADHSIKYLEAFVDTKRISNGAEWYLSEIVCG